ncbi:MAG: hypothetical protein AAF141_02235, partial [Pseudomonadota bacterium]
MHQVEPLLVDMHTVHLVAEVIVCLDLLQNELETVRLVLRGQHRLDVAVSPLLAEFCAPQTHGLHAD